jgi:hypothetical protein
MKWKEQAASVRGPRNKHIISVRNLKEARRK